MRISDWSSDVCSSDLQRSICSGVRLSSLSGRLIGALTLIASHVAGSAFSVEVQIGDMISGPTPPSLTMGRPQNRKSVGQGKVGSVRIGPGGGRIIKKKYNRIYKQKKYYNYEQQ